MRQWLSLFETDTKADRLTRAKALGYTVAAFHGTKAKFNEFEIEKGKPNYTGHAPHFANVKKEAIGYAGDGKVLSVLLRIRKPLVIPSTWATAPEDVPPTDEATYRLITGGQLPADTKRQRYLRTFDALEHAKDVHYAKTGNYNRKEIWDGLYQRLKKAGYDAIIWKDVRADHSAGVYDKIVMLDMSGIRLTTAKFDPLKTTSADIRA